MGSPRKEDTMTAAQTAPATATTWAIDPVHSSVEFSVKHMMVATVTGRFTRVEGTIRLDEADPTGSSVVASVDVASVDTGNAQRDGHLRTDDFFDAARYPTASFRSTTIERLDDERARLHGDLTIRGVTKPVVLEVAFEGQGQDASGEQRAGFTAEGAIDRLDYGITWNPALETGGVVVSNKVELTLHIAAIRQE